MKILSRVGRVLLAVLFVGNSLLGCGAALLKELTPAKELAFCGIAASLANFTVLAAVVLFCGAIRSRPQRQPGVCTLRRPPAYGFPPTAFLALTILLMVTISLRFEAAKSYYLTTGLTLPKIAAVLCPVLCGISYELYHACRVSFSQKGLTIIQPFRRTAALDWGDVEEIAVQSRRRPKGGMKHRVTIRSGRTRRTIRSTDYTEGGWRRFSQVMNDAVQASHISVTYA